MSDDVVERVARAIQKADDANDGEGAANGLAEDVSDRGAHIARTAISALHGEEMREKIARVVDPDGWMTFDRQTGELKRFGADDIETGPRRYVERSLAKADAIMALIGGRGPESTLEPVQGSLRREGGEG